MKRKKIRLRERRNSTAQSPAIGPDGWAINSADPVDPIDPRKRLYWRRMIECERATQAGNLPAIVDAIEHCVRLNMPPQPWIAHAVAALVARQMLIPTGRGRFNSRQKKWTENQKHFARWDTVRELLDEFEDDYRPPMEKVRAEAVERLKDTPAKGGEDAVKYSYDLVEQATKRGKAGKFYVTDFRPNGK